MDYFIKLNDSCKEILISKLLKFENDTSVCCLGVMNYSFNGIEGCYSQPITTRYSIQIDALFMINRLVWPKLMELYSCHPVLYDTLTKKEVNDNPQIVRIVFNQYKKWYANLKLGKKIPRYFPFNDRRYKWLGGRKSIVKNTQSL